MNHALVASLVTMQAADLTHWECLAQGHFVKRYGVSNHQPCDQWTTRFSS